MKRIITIFFAVIMFVSFAFPVYALTKDTTPPIIKVLNPSNNKTDVPISQTITITFNENIFKGKTFSNITLTDSKELKVSYKVSITNNLLSIKTIANLRNDTKYKLVIPVGAVVDKSGNSSKKATVLYFITIGVSKKVQQNPIKILVNGVALQLDAPVLVENGRTLVPVIDIFEALGAKTDWDGTTQTITATKGKNVVQLQIGNLVAKSNGEEEFMDVPAKIINNSTYVPVRFAGEIFGASVVWDGNTNSVLINDYSSTQDVAKSFIGTRKNDINSGAWWGENITKIARSGNITFTFAMDSQSGQRRVYLYQKLDGGTWIEGESFLASRPPNILVDSLGYVHVIAFGPFDNLEESSGGIFHVIFQKPNTIVGNYTKIYLTQADKRKDNLSLDNYGTYFNGAAIGKDDTILVAYNNSIQQKVGTNSLGARIYNPKENKWTYETVSKDMKSNYCYTFAFVSDKYYHVYAVEDDYDEDYAKLGEPYSNYCFRYGAVKHFQRLRTGGDWEETTLIDFNDKPGISKKDIWDTSLRIIDFTVDSSGIVHALIKYKGDYNETKIDLTGINKCYHYWKAENDDIWKHEQILPDYNLNWVKLWERDDKRIFYICSDNTYLYMVPMGTSNRFFISKFTEYYADGKPAYPFICNIRSGLPLSHDLHLVLYSSSMIARAVSIDVKLGDTDKISLPELRQNTISGIISLPKDEVAPSGGINVSIFTSTIEVGGAVIKTKATIPENGNSIKYSLIVNSNYRYRICYNLDKDKTYKYAGFGAYTPQGIVEYIKKGTLIDVNKDVNNINLTLYYKQ